MKITKKLLESPRMDSFLSLDFLLQFLRQVESTDIKLALFDVIQAFEPSNSSVSGNRISHIWYRMNTESYKNDTDLNKVDTLSLTKRCYSNNSKK
ncbi:hypothetical protein SAM19_03131 [Brevibacillus laterosporus]|nr:hypothetical protein [Brevibacillus laterosporus]